MTLLIDNWKTECSSQNWHACHQFKDQNGQSKKVINSCVLKRIDWDDWSWRSIGFLSNKGTKSVGTSWKQLRKNSFPCSQVGRSCANGNGFDGHNNRRLVEHVISQLVRTIARTLFAIANHALAGGLQVVRLTDQSAKVDENGGQIQHPAKFAGSIVPRESVMVVVKTFAHSAQDGRQAFGRRNALVIRTTAPQVSGWVHQPGHVQGKTVTENGTSVESNVSLFAPKIDGNHGGQNETGKQNSPQVVSEDGGEKRVSQGMTKLN